MELFGEFGVYRMLDGQPIIDDGRFGECYSGDSDGARELAEDLLAAADAYDRLCHG